jgi:hypothetical protein
MKKKAKILVQSIFLGAALFAAGMIFNIVIDEIRASSQLAPPIPCTSSNRMDIFEDEDSILYECQCQMLKTQPLCAWVIIGGVEPRAIRRYLRTHKHGKVVHGKRVQIFPRAVYV